ncbi:N-methylglutamate dehydrogenase subunit B [Tistlia consotensis]|uniref:Sarcosine oxidase subunit delta n=1 Tax=Tistlia consotensis USBA 355 TaxID=560819 RepID=A0A1Y6CQZ6_9PROT|nr:sarcosine oxidase subunit delta [Tistlia consotensis]SMF82428.1 sarcosine oxidase subunit delta [Tistlia consotensis USBA 355]SNS27143.1 N-methylglutamate dehydrogenase subunit B [Tistlia consotensis]
MLRIPCPFCGPRDHSEFSYLGDATVTRPEAEAPLDEWFGYVYLRDNPRGRHREHWHHAQGCRQWLVVERDTLTHEILGALPAREGSPAAGPAAGKDAAE